MTKFPWKILAIMDKIDKIAQKRKKAPRRGAFAQFRWKTTVVSGMSWVSSSWFPGNS